jgi:hypothetical protein
MLCIVLFLHVLEAIIIDVTSVSGVGDSYCATLSAQSFYRMPAYKTYSCQKNILPNLHCNCKNMFAGLPLLFSASALSSNYSNYALNSFESFMANISVSMCEL